MRRREFIALLGGGAVAVAVWRARPARRPGAAYTRVQRHGRQSLTETDMDDPLKQARGQGGRYL
jgi:hypothetical protein